MKLADIVKLNDEELPKIMYLSKAPHKDELSSAQWLDRKSTRLNSSHLVISYAVFCLKKQNLHRAPSLLSFGFFPTSNAARIQVFLPNFFFLIRGRSRRDFFLSQR